jgi:predicted pyridoxine 5'-phosphate oxidase superfamily flavin-nucleotide-binding protein
MPLTNIVSDMDKQLKHLVEDNTGALASINEEGMPHNIAVGSSRVVSENQILVTDNFMEETIQNILKNKNVSLVFWNTDPEKKKDCRGCEFRGTAEYFTSGEWVEGIRERYKSQCKNLPAKGAVLITVNETKRLA